MQQSIVRGAGPLYAQVRAMLLARLNAGAWAPGDLIPAETALARELAVSQGTVRKALDYLVGRNLLVRQQGVGTFVCSHDARSALFHFFHLVGRDGEQVLPRSRVLRAASGRARRHEIDALELSAGARVVRIERTRELNGRIAIHETIAVPAARFPGLSRLRQVPNTIYELYQCEYGITIHRADEQVSAVAASRRDASLLHCATGHPLLEIVRVAVDLEQAPVELRISRCDTRRHCYRNSIV